MEWRQQTCGEMVHVLGTVGSEKESRFTKTLGVQEDLTEGVRGEGKRVPDIGKPQQNRHRKDREHGVECREK